MNATTQRYLDFGLPATLPREQRAAWRDYLAGRSAPLRLLPTNGDTCQAEAMGGPCCGYPLLIDGSCPNNVEHRAERLWKVQAFITAEVGGGQRRPYAPTYWSTEAEAAVASGRLYRDHGPGMVEVEITHVPDEERPR